MNIILYVCDSLRADYLGSYGFPRNISPNIDKVSENSLVFENAFSQSTWTRASGASIFTSTYPPTHKVETTSDHLSNELTTLPDKLKELGYQTNVVSAMGNISTDFGFGSGVDNFLELYKGRSRVDASERLSISESFWRNHFNQENVTIATGADINTSISQIIDSSEQTDSFILAWSLDTHDPYFHRDPNFSKFSEVTEEEPFWPSDVNSDVDVSTLEDLYMDMVSYADREIGNLVDLLKRREQWSDTLLIITGDHGEAFGEHGKVGHGHAPYDEEIHVPLIFRFPGASPSGRIKQPTELIDIFPTILSWVDEEADHGNIEGKSLINTTQEATDDHVFTQTNMGGAKPKFSSIRNCNSKLISQSPPSILEVTSISNITSILDCYSNYVKSGKYQLFDIKSDPNERDPITDSATQANLIRFMSLAIKKAEIRGNHVSSTSSTDMSDEVENQLQSLGYIN